MTHDLIPVMIGINYLPYASYCHMP